MIDESALLPDEPLFHSGYLATPLNHGLLYGMSWFDTSYDNENNCRMNWPEYRYDNTDMYPSFLSTLIRKGIPFIWQYEVSDDFSYYAYNFPTENQPNNYGHFKTGDKRKNYPRTSKKFIAEMEQFSAVNELLLNIGIDPNGFN